MPPDPPTRLSIDALTADAIQLSWVPPRAGIDAYLLELRVDGTSEPSIVRIDGADARPSYGRASTVLARNALPRGVGPSNIVVAVVALNAAGRSAPSNDVRLTSRLPPTTPTEVTLIGDNDLAADLAIEWSPPADGCDGYVIEFHPRCVDRVCFDSARDSARTCSRSGDPHALRSFLGSQP